MTRPKFFLTTAIDYPNSRPHIGTAFEKVGADVQARYRRMEGFDVRFLMGNDENTVKVSKRAAELGQAAQSYCDGMARQFREVWDALGISYDTFIQTSHERHRDCARAFIQKVHDAGHLYKGPYGGWYCEGCEEFKTETQHAENAGLCPNHKTPLVRREEECWFFRQSAFAERLLKHYEENPDFIQPDTRRNEIIAYVQGGLRDINISRKGEKWGIPIPFDPDFTIYVWFDALLTYITGIGYGDDRADFDKWWPADTHFIGKDITRFHCALWPAMLWAAGEQAPKRVFGHGWVTVDGSKMGKALGNVVDPVQIIAKAGQDAYRWYFMRECPFPADGDYSGQRFEEVYKSELQGNLGNMLSRCVTLITKNYASVLDGTGGKVPESASGLDLAAFVERVRGHVEACRYSQALMAVVQEFLTPTNQYLEANAPWKLVKTDKEAAKRVLFAATQSLRIAAVLLKPFIPKAAETIYRSFNFSPAWEEVKYADAAALPAPAGDLRVTAALVDDKVAPLFPPLA
ncbi:MAG: methionine--tRNA ligase [Gemmataceae bacterium]|nr:methionine--tRNA ligase [Gemmataceae bacterium]